jgi:hypothetical protein
LKISIHFNSSSDLINFLTKVSVGTTNPPIAQ